MHTPASTPNRLIRLREVQHLTGLSRSSVYRLMGTGEFPASVKIGLTAMAWSSVAIEGWIQSKLAQ